MLQNAVNYTFYKEDQISKFSQGSSCPWPSESAPWMRFVHSPPSPEVLPPTKILIDKHGSAVLATVQKAASNNYSE